MPKSSLLMDFLFDGKRSRFSDEMLRWVDESARFLAFVETYRDKIRKKLRVGQDAESVLDIRAELETACRLLRDRRFAVVYEAYASAKGRAPDFTVTYRANTTFNVEVARIRGEAGPQDLPRKAERILRVLLDKLGQMQPGMGNLLAIQAPPALVEALDLEALMQEIKLLAEHKAPGFYALSRYPSPAAFYKDFLHLGGLLIWPAPAESAPPAPRWWINKQARPGLDEAIQRAVAKAMGAESY